jgi:hydroxymethylglutaryl-CoA lyase
MRVEVTDVSPRDGLQNERVLLPTATKLELIERLVGAGVRRLEATSFVDARRVPAMADAEAVMAGVRRAPGVSYVGLVLNLRGLERAIAAGCEEVNMAVVCTDGFARRNQGRSSAETVATFGEVAAAARRAGLGVSAVLSVAFGCPFEGEVPVSRVAEVAATVAAHAPDRLSLADTIGVASPADVRERLGAVREAVPEGVLLGAHFHNTRGTGLANVSAALEEGVGVFDACVGGIGGCPFAPNATGNISTEDLVYMLERMGVDTGLDLEALAATAGWLATHLGPLPGLYPRAGPFPPR